MTAQADAGNAAYIGFDAAFLEFGAQLVDDDALHLTLDIRHQLAQQGRQRAPVFLDDLVQIGDFYRDHFVIFRRVWLHDVVASSLAERGQRLCMY